MASMLLSGHKKLAKFDPFAKYDLLTQMTEKKNKGTKPGAPAAANTALSTSPSHDSANAYYATALGGGTT